MSYNIKILKNYILYFLLMILVCMVGISGVFAETITYTDIGFVTDKTTLYVSPDYTSSPLQIPAWGSYQLSQVREITINVNNQNIVANRHYQFEIALYEQVRLTNVNVYTVSDGQNVSCDVNYDYSTFGGQYPRWNFACPSASNYFTIILSNSSNQYLFDAGIFSWGNAILRYTETPIHDNGVNDIINNNNQNTQNIINNNNTNTQNIINNQNQNTQQQIESQKVCESIFIDKDNIVLDKRYLNSNGSAIASNDWGVTDYIEIPQENLISFKVIQSYTSATSANLCWYNSSKTLISCSSITNLTGSLTIPSNSRYFRSSIYKSTNIPTYEIKTCKNGNQALNDSINDDDTSGATNEASDFFSGFSTNTFGLTSIITAPLNLIQSLTSSTCSSLHLPLPYLDNKYLDLPCMSIIYSQYFGSFFTIYQTITYGIIAYWVCVRIFNLVKDFKNPEHDEIEVVDL